MLQLCFPGAVRRTGVVECSRLNKSKTVDKRAREFRSRRRASAARRLPSITAATPSMFTDQAAPLTAYRRARQSREPWRRHGPQPLHRRRQRLQC